MARASITGYRSILRRNHGLPRRLRAKMKREVKRDHLAEGLTLREYRKLWHG